MICHGLLGGLVKGAMTRKNRNASHCGFLCYDRCITKYRMAFCLRSERSAWICHNRIRHQSKIFTTTFTIWNESSRRLCCRRCTPWFCKKSRFSRRGGFRCHTFHSWVFNKPCIIIIIKFMMRSCSFLPNAISPSSQTRKEPAEGDMFQIALYCKSGGWESSQYVDEMPLTNK